jgi:transposase
MPALDRRVLNDVQWERVAPLLPGKPDDLGRSGEDNRRFVEAVLWVARTGSPWRDIHPDATKGQFYPAPARTQK